MNELIELFTIGPLPVTAYALCVTIGALLAVLLTVAIGRRRVGLDGSLSLCLAAIPGALIGARLLYCLTNIQYIQVDLGYNFYRFLLAPWEGGFTLYGSILGGMAGVWLYAKATRRAPRALLDIAAPGAALTLMFVRLAEYFSGQGLGKVIETEALQRFPLAVQSLWEEWAMPVFLYEAVAAGIIVIVTCLLLKGDGHPAEVFLILLGLTQILLESWRMDEFIRFGFVRFNQIASAVTMAVVLALRILRAVRSRGWSAWTIARIALFLAGIGIIIAIEFALDKSSIDNRLLYVVMAATLGMMGAALLADQPAKG